MCGIKLWHTERLQNFLITLQLNSYCDAKVLFQIMSASIGEIQLNILQLHLILTTLGLS